MLRGKRGCWSGSNVGMLMGSDGVLRMGRWGCWDGERRGC